MTTTTTTTTRTRRHPAGRHRGPRRRRGTARRVGVGLGALAATTGLVLVPVNAYFSDYTGGASESYAGTLDLASPGLEVTSTSTGEVGVLSPDGVNGDVVRAFLPGQLMRVSGTVSNDGIKSAWIRSAVDLTSASEELQPVLYFFAGSDVPSHQQLLDADVTDAAESRSAMAALPGYVGRGDELLGTGVHGPAAAVDKIAGVADNSFSETTADDTTSTGEPDEYHAQVLVYFDKDAVPSTQGRAFELEVVVEAVQLRNNVDPAGVDWADAIAVATTTTGAG